MKWVAAVTHLVQMPAKGEAACTPLWQVGRIEAEKSKVYPHCNYSVCPTEG